MEMKPDPAPNRGLKQTSPRQPSFDFPEPRRFRRLRLRKSRIEMGQPIGIENRREFTRRGDDHIVVDARDVSGKMLREKGEDLVDARPLPRIMRGRRRPEKTARIVDENDRALALAMAASSSMIGIWRLRRLFPARNNVRPARTPPARRVRRRPPARAPRCFPPGIGYSAAAEDSRPPPG